MAVVAKVVQTYKLCETCKEELKPIQLAPKNKMGRICKCGIFGKNGNKLN